MRKKFVKTVRIFAQYGHLENQNSYITLSLFQKRPEMDVFQIDRDTN